MSEDFVENSCLVRLVHQTIGDEASAVSVHVHTKEREGKPRKFEAHWTHVFRNNQRFTVSINVGGVAA
jgi:hypothetical protein